MAGLTSDLQRVEGSNLLKVLLQYPSFTLTVCILDVHSRLYLCCYMPAKSSPS